VIIQIKNKTTISENQIIEFLNQKKFPISFQELKLYFKDKKINSEELKLLSNNENFIKYSTSNEDYYWNPYQFFTEEIALEDKEISSLDKYFKFSLSKNLSMQIKSPDSKMIGSLLDGWTKSLQSPSSTDLHLSSNLRLSSNTRLSSNLRSSSDLHLSESQNNSDFQLKEITPMRKISFSLPEDYPTVPSMDLNSNVSQDVDYEQLSSTIESSFSLQSPKPPNSLPLSSSRKKRRIAVF